MLDVQIQNADQKTILQLITKPLLVKEEQMIQKIVNYSAEDVIILKILEKNQST